MDFTFDDTHPTQYIHDVQLIEKHTGKVFNEKLRFIYIEMPKFEKQEKELKNHLDKWLYVLKNLTKLDQMPPKVKERVFSKLFRTAEIANYSPKERAAYIQSEKYARDWKNVLETTLLEGMEKGFQEGIEKGIEKAKEEVVQKAIQKGFDDETIAELTGISKKEIATIRKKLNG